MTDWLISGLILAETAKPEDPPFWSLLPPFLILPVLMYLLMIRPAQQEQKQRQSLISSLKKNDRVVTTGGLIGQVALVSTDGKEVTLKVGDSVRIPFLASSIVRVLDGTTPEDPPKS